MATLYNVLAIMYASGLEACPLLKSDLLSLDFVVNRLFMKLFKTSNIDLPSVSWSKRVKKFEAKFHAYTMVK